MLFFRLCNFFQWVGTYINSSFVFNWLKQILQQKSDTVPCVIHSPVKVKTWNWRLLHVYGLGYL